MGTSLLVGILRELSGIKAMKCLSIEPGSEDAVNKMWVILFRSSSKAEEAEIWFSVRSFICFLAGCFLPTSGI